MATVTNFRYTTSPLIIILGATAVGKTKLSVHLSKRFNGEIVNADSMQIYEGLDIATAKPTLEERDNVPHHLFSYINPLDRSNTVVDYRNDALPVIESIFSRSRLPLIVGGTNYYIESLLFHLNPPDPLEPPQNEQYSSLEAELSDENLSKLTSIQLHELLSKIDKPTSIRKHPNEERKIRRAIEFYRDSGGIPLSEALKKQHSESGFTYRGSFRFHRCCLLWLTCQKDELEERINSRIQSMLDRGLIDELEKFHEEYNRTCAQAEQSYDYTRGIFQAIGFKEFHDYLLLSEDERKSEHGKKVFANAIERLKVSTRQYSRYQEKWLRMRLLQRVEEHSPDVYELDTTNLTLWKENVEHRAESIIEAFLKNEPIPFDALPKKPIDEPVYEQNTCTTCQRVFHLKSQWFDHLKGKQHKRMVRSTERTTFRRKLDNAIPSLLNTLDRRLYEYALRAVCSPLHVIEPGITSDQLATHIAKLFNIDPEEHEMKYMRPLKAQPCPVILFVDVKRARNLPGEDQNGLSDPYCKVSVVYTPSKGDSSSGKATFSSHLSSDESPTTIKRSRSLFFSCTSSPSSKNKLKTPSSFRRPRSSSRIFSKERPGTISSDKSKLLTTVTFRTEICPKTVNPEWNEHFEFEIENVDEQYLHITVYDSDRDPVPGMKTIVQEKRGVSQKIRGIRTLFTTGEVEDDFLGQFKRDIRALAKCDGEQWFPLTGLNQTRAKNTKSRGDIYLGLKVHFKLDDNSTADQTHVHTSNTSQFRRRHSILSSTGHTTSSIVLRSSIFRKNFRPSAVQVRDYTKTSIFEGETQLPIDSYLTPTKDFDSPLLIEEYHQLFRIIMLHQLEDAREANRDKLNGIMIDWDGALNELSYSILVQFRVLYNISTLSETFIQLLVIMELRCSEDYALFISQAVIEAYLKMFMDKVQQRTDVDDLGFTDYEKTVFKETFYLFIGHYKQRIHCDAPWFFPSKENLANIQSIFDTLCTLFQLKICSNETVMKTHFEEIMKTRLQIDINDSFTVHAFVFNDKEDIQFNKIRDFLDYVKKIAESMSNLPEYNKIFASFDINYTKICFFETDSAADRLSELTKCLLTNMTDSFETYSKPVVKATSSIYDPNLIQYSILLLNLYLYLQTIVTSLRNNLETRCVFPNLNRDWAMNAFRLKLIEYRQWFSPTMKFLLEGFVANIRQAMERAVEDDNELIPEEDIVLYSRSSMAATGLCIKICREWESIDYPDINVRYTALIKLTNTICEQCQHYARRTARKLSENRYFTNLNLTGSFNVSKKLCMLVNDIEYVKRNVLSSLPNLLNFSGIIEKMIENYASNDFQQTRVTLERLIKTAEHEMTDVIKFIFEHVATLVHASLRVKISNYYRDEKAGKVDCMKDVNRYIDQQILHQLYKGLEPVQYSRVACAIRIKTLQCLRELLSLQEPPNFYERVLQSFDQLAAYFEAVCREEPHLPGPPCDEITTLRRTLQTCALTTEQLQLCYFREICQIHSPHEYPTNNGEIVFRTAYEIANSLVTISVFILCCRNLPKMDYIGASDPYVILELLPSSFYQKTPKEYKTSIRKRTVNPEYNELFQWHRLPLNILHERGAVLRLSVWDEDYVKDDFIGECFVQLTNIESLKNRVSLRDVPVSEVLLRRPYKNIQPRVFELIRNRAAFDEQAAVFLKQRTAIMQSGNGSDGASVISDDRKSSGSYANTALRSLLCMFPFHIGLGMDSTPSYSRSDVANDDELI
ncbi:hypothetical protein I4U23_009225 [Adineta vaga]|nr:hypothetical protein I4U23_009225 [Adineta vaga]